jgi:ubiquinone biosynthesis protein COQ4
MGRALRAGAPLGDVLVLKLDALSDVSEDVKRRLERLRGYAPIVELSLLRDLPGGTLGHEYASFLDANGIKPLAISAPIRERFRDNPYVLRYTATHDLHHVLTGFDAGLAGEIGVLAFTVAQGSAPVGYGLLWFARVLYAILSPTQARKIWHNVRVGLALGKRAELVIAARIEAHFEEPLEEVRRKMGIADPREAGVLPSGTSIVGKLLYPAPKPD